MINITTDVAKELICPLLSKDGVSSSCRAEKCMAWMAWQIKDAENKQGLCIIMNFFWK